MAKFTKFIKKTFLDFFDKNGVVVYKSCEVMKVSPRAYYNNLEKDPKFKQAVEDIKEKYNEELVVSAKQGLKVNLNRNKQSAIEYVLNNKTNGEYSNTVKNQLTGAGGGPITYKEYFPALDPETKEEK